MTVNDSSSLQRGRYIAKIITINNSTETEKEEIDYFWQDGKILALRQKDLQNDGDETVYEYLYDSDGELQAIASDGFRWTLEKNLLGDVVGVNLVNAGVPAQPMRVADIDYDAYGAPTFSNYGGQGFLAMLYMALNPILYRGYLGISVGGVFCYYLGSRFYSPELGRFLNADVHQDTQQGVVGANMFAYCNNNPVMLVDADGKSPKKPPYIKAHLINGSDYFFIYIALRFFSNLSPTLLPLVAYNYYNNYNIEKRLREEDKMPKSYLHGQSLYPYNKMRFGLLSLSENGCGVLALYNAFYYAFINKKTTSKSMPLLATLILQLEIAGVDVAYGLLGLNLLDITSFLAERSWKVNTYKLDANYFDSKMNAGDAAIIEFKNADSATAHVVFIRKLNKKSYAAYNYYDNSKSVVVFPSFLSLIDGDLSNFVYGIKIIKCGSIL